jgi:hypothetical protein
MTYTRTPIPIAELVADLDNLGRAASVINSSLTTLLADRLVPESALPTLHASRRAAASLVTHLESSRVLVEGA